MTAITIISIGKKSSPPYQDLIGIYEKRLQTNNKINWRIIAPGQNADDESKLILSAIEPKSFVIALDERGQQLDNVQLAARLETVTLQAKPLVFVIGGAYGFNQSVHDRADVVLSLSKLVMPHQMVRLLLIEQIYRSQMIMQKHPYHHE